MTCEKVRGLLAEGGGLPEEAEAHLAACPGCQRVAQRWAVLRREFAALAAEPEPPFLHQRIMAAVRQAAAEPLPWWRRVPRAAWASAGVAAVLVVGVLATQGVLRLPSVQRGAQEEPAPQVAPPPKAQVVAEHGDASAVERPAKAVARPAGEAARRGLAGPPPATAAPAANGAVPGGEFPARQEESFHRPLARSAATPAPGAVTERMAAVDEDDGPREAVPALVAAAARAAGDGVRPAAPREEMAAAPRRRPPEGMAAATSLPAQVRVVLLAAAGEEACALYLPEAAAPPQRQVWVVVVGEDGRLVLEGPPEDALGELQPVWERAVAGVQLAPGRYRAGRLRP